MIKILWVCNLVMPDFSEEFGIKKAYTNGWLTGMFYQIKRMEDVCVSLAFPIYDEFRIKDGTLDGTNYYSYHGKYDFDEYDIRQEQDFRRIIAECKPDIIHVWGTEYNHARSVFQVVKELNLLGKTLFDIQGILTECTKYYAVGLPEEVITEKDLAQGSIREEIDRWKKRAENERVVFTGARFVSGRTDWDKFYVHGVNPDVKYLHCDRVLRPAFYDNFNKWNLKKCRRNQIFVSQGGYPLKGIHHLIKVAGTLIGKYTDLKIKVAGFTPLRIVEDGEMTSYGKYLKELIDEYGLENHIEFIGHIDEQQMIDEYKQAHVAVICSNIENAPNSISEAMFIGTPVIASNVGGISSLVDHGKTGFLYQRDFDYMLEGYLRMAFENDNLLENISREATIVSCERCNPDRIAKEQVHNYQLIFGKEV